MLCGEPGALLLLLLLLLLQVLLLLALLWVLRQVLLVLRLAIPHTCCTSIRSARRTTCTRVSVCLPLPLPLLSLLRGLPLHLSRLRSCPKPCP